MSHNQNELNTSRDKEVRSTEAELFAEILSRMDGKLREEHNSLSQVPGSTASRQTHELDLVELFYYLLSKLHYILLGMILGALLMVSYATNWITPIYTATSKLYIMGTTGSSIIADLQIGTVLTMDYQEVFKTWEVHQMVNEELGTNYPYSMLQGMISVMNPEDTRILYITARHPDSQTAADVANAYASAAKRFIVQTMKTDEPSTFSIALVPGVAGGAGITGYLIRGILLGTVLASGLLVLIFLLDSRPKSPEDIMRYANIPTLAVIPANFELSDAKTRGRKAGRT
ncbi:MAG: hypothetical protein QM308_06605 [Bacillota bacterium]|nr:hypothetical protein [Bacillota bacterium]